MLASTSSNPHLAVLITLLGSDDPTIKYAANAQLKDWTSQGLNKIPLEIVKIYELLAGNTNRSTAVSSVHITQGLSWEQCFGLQLWYGSDWRNSLDDAVAMYSAAFEDIETGVCPPTRGSKDLYDINFRLLSLYHHTNDNKLLVAAMNARESSAAISALDARIAYYLHLILSTQFTGDKDSSFMQLGPQLADEYILQLQSSGLWRESVVIALGLDDSQRAYQHISQLVALHISEDDFKSLSFQRLCLPPRLLAQARALACRYTGDRIGETLGLLDTQDFTEAHKTILSTVAPAAVIADDYDLVQLGELLAAFDSPTRRDLGQAWITGGGIYADYTTLIHALRDSNDTHNGIDRDGCNSKAALFDKVEPVLTRLTMALPAYNDRVSQTTVSRNAEVSFSSLKVAASIVNQVVIDQILALAPPASKLHDQLVQLSPGLDHGITKTKGVASVYLRRQQF
ncbi:hypothetical protein NADFUDRAFT_71917 [Nadsonia fulvescens var. elongata DSM 6958]|uniref:Nuclear pore complex protein NUP96 C-terminal domain-containing protein n=1 Tax=Nadsonia fulvescens var. elongata DSM 6958 TaxID=857566 RepID=A0A1E3PFJ3_9ASCO|nr:hypothetical protein NADFUDRAFT_71917 [Nadsonia fulvescens var. elongata DSM 6958]